MDERTEEGEERTSLETSVENLLEETRILLPGTQTLFGFQLIAVFNDSFHDRLTSTERNLHLVAMLLTILAVALFMTPATYRRQVEQQSVSERFVRLVSVFLVLGTVPLAVAISIDAYLVAQVVTENGGLSLAMALGAMGVFVVLWYVVPHAAKGSR